jgi:hypothetical protein
MATVPKQETRSPSIWAFILIGLGVIWLLFQANILSGANLAVLFRMWPIVLIGFGLELLFGRGSRSLSLLIGLGTIVLLIALMVVGPSLGLAPNVEVKTAQYSEPIEDATSAQVNLDLSVGDSTIQAVSDSNNLIDADLRYVGEVDFRVDGATEKFVTLTSENDNVQWFDFLGVSLSGSEDDELQWNIGLTPDIPLDLRVNNGVGESIINLANLQITRFDYDSGVGSSTITLADGSYAFDLNGGVGSATVIFPEGADITADVNAGVGAITLDVPDNAAVHLETTGGIGEISVPSNFNRISGGDDDLNRDGVWETEGYSSADVRISITYNGGVGELTVQ